MTHIVREILFVHSIQQPRRLLQELQRIKDTVGFVEQNTIEKLTQALMVRATPLFFVVSSQESTPSYPFASPDKRPIQNKPVFEGWTISFALLFVACWLRRESRFSTFCRKHSCCCCCSTGKTWTWLSVWRQTSLFCQPPSRLSSGSGSDWWHAHLPHCSKDKLNDFSNFQMTRLSPEPSMQNVPTFYISNPSSSREPLFSVWFFVVASAIWYLAFNFCWIGIVIADLFHSHYYLPSA